jgi:HEAT repeat protein
MHFSHYHFFLMVILGLLVSCEIHKAPVVLEHPQTTDSACVSKNDLSAAIKSLASGLDDQQLTQVRQVIIDNAKRSEKCRTEVVNALMTAMDKPNLDFEHDTESYNTWSYGAGFLGELKATEALDLLLAHLNATDGLSPNHFPVIGGVINMGPVAIPKLSEVLKKNPDRYMRRSAAFCIADIGGSAATNSLHDALSNEADQCNRKFLDISIKALENRQKPNQITADDRAEWYSAFYCS